MGPWCHTLRVQDHRFWRCFLERTMRGFAWHLVFCTVVINSSCLKQKQKQKQKQKHKKNKTNKRSFKIKENRKKKRRKWHYSLLLKVRRVLGFLEFRNRLGSEQSIPLKLSFDVGRRFSWRQFAQKVAIRRVLVRCKRQLLESDKSKKVCFLAPVVSWSRAWKRERTINRPRRVASSASSSSSSVKSRPSLIASRMQ